MRSFGRNPETAFSEKELRGELTSLETELYNIIVPEAKQRAINPRNFKRYNQNDVEADIAYVDRIEKRIGKENGSEESSKRGELFEAIVNNGITDYGWFGKDAKAIVPSRYDDLKNKIDSIVVFKISFGRSTLALTMDMTKDALSAREKLDSIKNSLDEGKLTKIKYFELEDFRGEEENVPRVIVGADRISMDSVATLMLRDIKMTRNNVPKGSETRQEVEEGLKNHPLQLQILEEIRAQLEAFESYARRKGQIKIANRYKESLGIVKHVVSEKGESQSITKRAGGRTDDVQRMLMQELGKFK